MFRRVMLFGLFMLSACTPTTNQLEASSEEIEIEVVVSDTTAHQDSVCNAKMTRVHWVVVMYDDTTYAFKMDSSTMEVWGFVPTVSEWSGPRQTVDISDWTHPVCENTNFVNIAHVVYDYTAESIRLKGIAPLDSAVMVQTAKDWMLSGAH